LVLDLEPQADPIAGIVHDGSGFGSRFVGWMALTRAIELALETAGERPTPPATNEPDPLPPDRPPNPEVV